MSAPVIEAVGGRLRVTSDYNARYVKAARDAGGRWDSTTKTWQFDPRDEARVRAICVECYGSDGQAQVQALVTLRVACAEISESATQYGGACIMLAGRMIARRGERDWAVKLGEGVVLESGAFESSCGSRKNPSVASSKCTAVLLVRDVPAKMAEEIIAQRPGVTLALEGSVAEPASEALAAALELSNVEELRAERARLVARVAEIDALLGA